MMLSEKKWVKGCSSHSWSWLLTKSCTKLSSKAWKRSAWIQISPGCSGICMPVSVHMTSLMFILEAACSIFTWRETWDPLSPSLLNNVIAQTFEELQVPWDQTSNFHGIRSIGYHTTRLPTRPPFFKIEGGTHRNASRCHG